MRTKYRIIKTEEELNKLIKCCKETGYACIDFETNAQPIYNKTFKPTILSVTFQPGFGCSIPLDHFETKGYTEPGWNWKKMLKLFGREVIENPDIVEEFLIKSGFHGVKYYDSSEQWRFGMDEDNSTNSIKLSKNTLTFKDFKYSENGDLISLIQLKKKINFKTAYNYIALKTNFIDTSPEYIESEIELPFGGWYKHIDHKNNEFCELVTYNKNILNEFEKIPSKLLLKDGVSITTQEKFDIRYCSESHRIIIPCLDDDKLIGAIGRFNKKKEPKTGVDKIPKPNFILSMEKSFWSINQIN